MSENLKKYMEEISKDEKLVQRMNKADKDEIIAMAKELNIELTEEDFEEPKMQELNDDELETVAAGAGCGCVLIGSGRGDGLRCECVAGGGGGVYKEISYCTGRGNGGCGCPVAGVGATDGRACTYLAD